MGGIAVRRTCNPFTGLPELEVTRQLELAPDPCLVETAPLAGCLKEFVEGWRRVRPSIAGRRGVVADDVDPISPYASLASETGLSEDTIRRVRNPTRNPYVELRVVDALISAGVGDSMMFHDGTLNIVQNSKSAAACDSCGGSTTYC